MNYEFEIIDHYEDGICDWVTVELADHIDSGIYILELSDEQGHCDKIYAQSKSGGLGECIYLEGNNQTTYWDMVDYMIDYCKKNIA